MAARFFYVPAKHCRSGSHGTQTLVLSLFGCRQSIVVPAVMAPKRLCSHCLGALESAQIRPLWHPNARARTVWVPLKARRSGSHGTQTPVLALFGCRQSIADPAVMAPKRPYLHCLGALESAQIRPPWHPNARACTVWVPLKACRSGSHGTQTPVLAQFGCP